MGLFAAYQYHLVFGAIGLALIGIVVPPMVAGLGFPTRDSLTISSQGMQFARRGRVWFVAISGWSAEDYLRLCRRNGPTLVIVAQDAPARRRLHDQFRTGCDFGRQVWRPAPPEPEKRVSMAVRADERWERRSSRCRSRSSCCGWRCKSLLIALPRSAASAGRSAALCGLASGLAE